MYYFPLGSINIYLTWWFCWKISHSCSNVPSKTIPAIRTKTNNINWVWFLFFHEPKRLERVFYCEKNNRIVYCISYCICFLPKHVFLVIFNHNLSCVDNIRWPYWKYFLIGSKLSWLSWYTKTTVKRVCHEHWTACMRKRMMRLCCGLSTFSIKLGPNKRVTSKQPHMRADQNSELTKLISF